MNQNLASGLVLAAATLLPVAAGAADLNVERIEPPSWWIGMKDDRLQLLVHGAHIADATPELHANGVRIESVTRVANPNYLFIDLRIRPDATPGAVDLVFRRGDATLHKTYELQARAPGSAERRGYTSADTILNLVPDRFANGDPSNDDVPGYPDKARRSDDEAGRHGGDIAGIVKHLDYIAGMGYTFIWPTPLLENNQPTYSYHGYAITDTYKVDPRFGTNEQYRQMVQQAAAQGVGVIQDIVLNHIGSHHWWMDDLPAPDWLGYDNHFVPTEHARTTASDPYAAKVDHDNFVNGWFSRNMPDMNQKNPLLATYQIQNTLWWIEYAGLRGVRVDTYGYSDADFLSRWSKRVMDEYPHMNMVGEEWSGNPVVVSHWLRGVKNRDGHVSSMPGMMDFPLHYVLRRALVDNDSMHSGLADLYEALVNDNLYPEPSNMVLFEGNHDVPRLYSVLGEDLALWKMAIAYVLTMPRTPQLYYGTEILMTSPTVRDDGAARRDFPGGWAGDKINAFTGEGLSPAQREAQAYLRALMQWRKTQPVIHHGQLMHFWPQDGTYAWVRRDARDAVMVVINKNHEAKTLDMARFREALGTRSRARDVVTGQVHDLSTSVTVPARGVLVLQFE
jgi:glycosidase